MARARLVSMALSSLDPRLSVTGFPWLFSATSTAPGLLSVWDSAFTMMHPFIVVPGSFQDSGRVERGFVPDRAQRRA